MRLKTFNLKWLALVAGILIILSGCADDKKTEEVAQITGTSSEVVKNAESSYDSSKRLLKSPMFELTLLSTEMKKDIDGNDSWYIYATIKNLSKESMTPDSVWNTYLKFSDKEKADEALYQQVLPKKDLDGSEYKKAIDNMSKEIKPNESLKIGAFYALPKDRSVFLSVLNEEMVVFHTEKLDIPFK